MSRIDRTANLKGALAGFLLVLIWTLTGFGQALAQDTPGGAPVAAAPAAPAFDASKGDPAGLNTGDKANAVDAAGTPFVPPSPADSDDAKTKADKKKALDEYNEM